MRSRLTDATEALGEAFDKTMRALGAALTAGTAMPATADDDAAFAAYAKRWAGCAGGVDGHLGNGDVERVFAL